MVWGAVVGMTVSQLIGMILYSKLFLGKPWMRGTFPGKTWEQISEKQKETFHIEFVFCLLSQAVLVMVMHYVIGPYLRVTSLEMAVKIGFSLAGVFALLDIPHCAFGQRAVSAFLIDHLYNALVLVAMAASFVYFG